MASAENRNGATDETAEPAALEPGAHVFVGKTHNSGPYASTEDAQAFIDGHLEGKGEVRVIE